MLRLSHEGEPREPIKVQDIRLKWRSEIKVTYHFYIFEVSDIIHSKILGQSFL